MLLLASASVLYLGPSRSKVFPHSKGRDDGTCDSRMGVKLANLRLKLSSILKLLPFDGDYTYVRHFTEVWQAFSF